MVGQSQVGPNLEKPAKPTDPIKIDLSEREEAVYGKKVSVQLMNNYLSLAEVEVWGEYSLFDIKFPVRCTCMISNIKPCSNLIIIYCDRCCDQILMLRNLP